MFRNQRVLAAVSMTFLSLCGLALIVGAAFRPGAGAITGLWVGMAVLAIVTVVRAWQLGRKQQSQQVHSSRAWKWLVFLASLVGSGIYAALAVNTPEGPAVIGMLLLLIANLIPMLLFEPEPRPV